MKLLPILILLMLSFHSIAGVEYKKFEDPQKEQAYRVLIDELRKGSKETVNIETVKQAIADGAESPAW